MSDDFVVNDKRLFTKDGEINAPTEPETENPEPAPEAPPAPEEPKTGPGGGVPPLPPASFTGLLVGLATSAFLHLGEGPPEDADGGSRDLAAAKHAIDLLGILQNKTRGNLDEEEQALLTTLLYDLRMKFVQASK